MSGKTVYEAGDDRKFKVIYSSTDLISVTVSRLAMLNVQHMLFTQTTAQN